MMIGDGDGGGLVVVVVGGGVIRGNVNGLPLMGGCWVEK